MTGSIELSRNASALIPGSAGLSTDVFSQPDGVIFQLEPYGGLLKTPACPLYISGNCFLSCRPFHPSESKLWVERWIASNPNGYMPPHLSICWETGLEINELDCPRFSDREKDSLMCTTVLACKPFYNLSHSYQYRCEILDCPSEWKCVLSFIVEEFRESESSEFLTWLYTHYRIRSKTEGVQWYGVYASNELVGAAGVFCCQNTYRIDEVVTKRSQRRKGVCAFLVSFILNSIATCDESATVYVFADFESPQETMYRGFGFTPVSRKWCYRLPPSSFKG